MKFLSNSLFRQIKDWSDKSFNLYYFKNGKKEFYIFVNWILSSTGFWSPTQQSDDRKLVSDDWEVGRRWGLVASRHRCQLGDKVRTFIKFDEFKNLQMKFLLQNDTKMNRIKFLYIITLIPRLDTFKKKKIPISLNKI